ncbi:unnamed protein product [Triticum turgidum subsp. durum]|uniref:Uncharacterized protein n=1 Tax=Triticum turgidum subsp. durum TaxID=4567 RepID=A0A9R1C5J4_TRITD|nr:unnamed protein product [Triticum turgidum subsp. durum]
MFNDITVLLLQPGMFKDVVDMFMECYHGMGIVAVAGKIITLIRPTGPLTSQSCSTFSPKCMPLPC